MNKWDSTRWLFHIHVVILFIGCVNLVVAMLLFDSRLAVLLGLEIAILIFVLFMFIRSLRREGI